MAKPADVVLLNSSFVSERKDKIEHIQPHLRVGIASIAAYLRESGFRVAVVDSQAPTANLDRLVAGVVSRKPRFLFLSAYTIEINDAARVAESVKKQIPDLKAVIGGYHVSAIPLETMKEFAAFDIGVIGEGEHTAREILDGKEPAEIRGIIHRNGSSEIIRTPPREGRIALDTLPMPAWDLYDLKSYDAVLPVEPLRGCPFSCTFCFRTVGKEVTYKSPPRVLAEIKRGIDEFGIHSYRFLAGTFPLKKSHAVEICEGIIREGYEIDWSSSVRIDTVDEELLRLMKKAGCSILQLGIESGDPEILRRCAKGITPEMAEETVRACKRIGLKVGANFILGLPHETRESVEKTYRLSIRLRRYVDSVNFAVLVPYPGSEIYELTSRNAGGVGLPENADWADFGKQSGTALKHANFQEGELQKLQARFYLKYYLGCPWKVVELFSLGRALQVLKRLFGL